MFGRLKSSFHLGEARSVMMEVFRSIPVAVLPFDPDALSMKLVVRTYGSAPEVFEGKMGKVPHKVATAAVALAEGLEYAGLECGEEGRRYVFLALGNVLLSASANQARYKFSDLDRRLIDMAFGAYRLHEEETREATSAVVGSLGL